MKRVLIIVVFMTLMCGCSNDEVISVSNVDKLYYNTDKYYGYLVIPKINLKNGFYNVDSRLNNVNKNVTLIDCKLNNTYIFAAHSGSGRVAYFNNIKNLELGDDIYVKFKDKLLHYQVSEIRNEVKLGQIHVKNQENMIVLTTCNQKEKGYQLIVEGILKEN